MLNRRIKILYKSIFLVILLLFPSATSLFAETHLGIGYGKYSISWPNMKGLEVDCATWVDSNLGCRDLSLSGYYMDYEQDEGKSGVFYNTSIGVYQNSEENKHNEWNEFYFFDDDFYYPIEKIKATLLTLTAGQKNEFFHIGAGLHLEYLEVSGGVNLNTLSIGPHIELGLNYRVLFFGIKVSSINGGRNSLLSIGVQTYN